MQAHLPFVDSTPTDPGLTAALARPLDRDAYVSECVKRWYGAPLRDARGNWKHWQELRPILNEAMLRYLEDSGSGLSEFLWKLQTRLQPDPARLDPLLDFCDHHQKVFLRRGLVIYCAQILRIIEAARK